MKTENLICSGISCSAIMCMVSFLGLVVLVEACVIFLLRIPYVEVSDEFFFGWAHYILPRNIFL